VFPNISAAHKAHTLLALSCATCHTGGGSGTTTHGDTLTVAFPAAYNATNGAALMQLDGSCANVSCHGGKTSPRWRGGRIDLRSECAACHGAGTAAGVPQANSYYSGEHQKHLVDIGLLCTDCHDMTVVSGAASHFSGLNTPAFELAPASTMRAALNFSSGATRSCAPGSTPPAGSFSIGVCHSVKNW
jgi:predicted CxxxxCH...CXXCH cytochrome family protein